MGSAYGVTKKVCLQNRRKTIKRSFFFTSKWHKVVKLGHSVPQQAREGGWKIIRLFAVVIKQIFITL
jgi:hypothetical protein